MRILNNYIISIIFVHIDYKSSLGWRWFIINIMFVYNILSLWLAWWWRCGNAGTTSLVRGPWSMFLMPIYFSTRNWVKRIDNWLRFWLGFNRFIRVLTHFGLEGWSDPFFIPGHGPTDSTSRASPDMKTLCETH